MGIYVSLGLAVLLFGLLLVSIGLLVCRKMKKQSDLIISLRNRYDQVQDSKLIYLNKCEDLEIMNENLKQKWLKTLDISADRNGSFSQKIIDLSEKNDEQTHRLADMQFALNKRENELAELQNNYVNLLRLYEEQNAGFQSEAN
jgi:hypothetical protein